MTSELASIAERVWPAQRRRWWLFSPALDIGAFLGSAAASFLLLAIGAWLGVLHSDSPTWAWVPTILLIDVAHVWSTGFRVYFDRHELARRPLLYVAVPVVSFILAVAIYGEGASLFWRVLAYLAVFHFVRQQYGWVALYRARLGENDTFGHWVDSAAIYLATIYPLVYWHAHLPREFWWFRPNDFAGIPRIVEAILCPIYWGILTFYLLRMAYQWVIAKTPNPGKDIVVITTALCWHVGIITFNSDYAFTVTNVIIHGVPYMVLVYWYRLRRRQTHQYTSASSRVSMLATFLATIWLLAYLEEMFWHRGIWHERTGLFGSTWDVGWWEMLLVPLLAVPQMTHYILDGFIWRRRTNPDLAVLFRDD
ncbi:MAG: hypothetical protein KatS3mg105_1490 [Gemmatales bacterium]|nr:MAG: hypothetical protein KatS3mg105_1490 [Gemmatales bacterium]